MASWQAYLATWILKRRFKPKLARARDVFEIRKVMQPAAYRIPRHVRITPDRVGGVRGEWIETLKRSDITLLYLHGGGYVACSVETHRPITAGFAQQGFKVFAPEYRLAPEHVFPAAIEDALAVYRALLEAGIESRKIVVAGDSAGGGLALALLLSLRDAGARLPAACALFSPWTDLAATGASIIENDRHCALFRGANIGPTARYYLGQTDPRNPLASPLYADLSGLPPLVIHVSADEVLRDDSLRIADRARAAGLSVDLKIWPVVPHVWQLAPILPEARESLREAAEFLRAHIAMQASVGKAS